jgi:two-component system CheB/CheR fusion protein
MPGGVEAIGADETEDLAVVGVGASAGGLEAFQELIGSIAAGLRRSWVLVQHLDPDHESLLPELLARRTSLPVTVIRDGMRIKPGAIHLIPPGAELRVEGRHLRLAAFESPRGLRRPIDVFFETLAASFGSRCAAIVLSGTGSDGSAGVRAVKEAGGLVFVQDPRQAKYDGMPKSALATNAVDLVLPARDMVCVIDEYFDRRSGIEPTLENDAQFIERVARHVRYRTGLDFSHYKRPTLLRRLARRMSVLGIHTPTSYVQRLVTDTNEAKQLVRDILINVTAFFRDSATFDTLRKVALAKIVEGKSPGQDIRVWVPGCSTGQEAYSIAMLIEEELQRVDARPNVSIFATDIDVDAIRVAREGLYPNTIASEVPRHLLDRYFTTTPQGYRVCASLRDMVRVSHHNVAKDPPFSKLDLVSCRNLLIYFDNQLQARAGVVFHYALNPGGFLFLGPSETLSGEGFETIDVRDRLYRRRSGPARPLDIPLVAIPEGNTDGVEMPAIGPDQSGAIDMYERAVLAHHTPAFVVVNVGREIVYASGRTSRFLELASGPAQLSLPDMLKSALKPAVRALLAGIGDAPGDIRYRPFEGRIDETDVHLLLTAERLRDDNILLVFQDRFDPRADGSVPGQQVVEGEQAEAYVNELEQKLDAAHQTIRTTIEELETSNEELKSSNEEMMSMNEELQSANEELSTINEELQTKVAELNLLNDDQRNLIESSGIATIFLDRALNIRSFTPAATRFFRLVSHDRGRPFDDVVHDVDGPPLVELCRQTLESGDPIETRRRDRSGTQDLLVRVQPYVAARGPSGGVVVTLTEVTEITSYARRLEEAQALAEQNLNEVLELYRVTPQAKALLDKDLRFLRVNQQLAEITGLEIEDLIGCPAREIVPQLGRRVFDAASTVLEVGKPISASDVTVYVRGEQRIWEVDLYPVRRAKGDLAVGLNLRDVTKHKVMEAELRRLMRELQHRVKNMLANVTALINRARRDEGDPRAVMDTLVLRIRALAKTHNLLTAQNWRPSRLLDVLTPELTEVYGDKRITLKGPDMRVNARATLAIGMAVHELATNAAKYGALSNDQGRLSVVWARLDEGDGDVLLLRWTEQSGPVVAAPRQLGFGSQLVKMTVEKILGGRFESEFDASGFKARLYIPFDRATEDDGNAADELEAL